MREVLLGLLTIFALESIHADTRAPGTYKINWAQAVNRGNFKTVHPSRSVLICQVRVPGFGDVQFRYENPNTAANLSRWDGKKDTVLRKSFGPPNKHLSYIWLVANANAPYETNQLIFPGPVKKISFPLYDFDERSAQLKFSTPAIPGTTFSKESGTNTVGGRWTLNGGSLGYQGNLFEQNEHFSKNIVVMTVANPKGFTVLEITTSAPAAVGLGDLNIISDYRANPSQMPASESDLPKLIKQLGAKTYADRTRATQKLLNVRIQYYDQLKEAYQNTDDPEIESRLKQILQQSGNRTE